MLAQATPVDDTLDDESPHPNHPEGSGGGVASIAQAIDLIKRELEIDDATILGLLRSWGNLARDMKGLQLQTEPTPELRTAIHKLLVMMGLETTGHCDFGAYTHTQIAEPVPEVEPAVAQVRMSNHA